MKPTICKSELTWRKNSLVIWAGFVASGMLLSGCQQVLDRLVIELKGSELNTVSTSTLDERSSPEESKPRTKKTPSNEITIAPANIKAENSPNALTQKDHMRATTDTPPATETQARKLGPSVSSALKVRSQVQTIDEDGNPFVGNTDTTKNPKTPIYIED